MTPSLDTTPGGKRTPPGRCRRLGVALGFRIALASLFAAGAAISASPVQAGVVETIRQSGHLGCGVVMEPDDWDRVERHGDLDILSQDFCKAVAVVLLGDKAAVSLRQYATEDSALDGLQRGQVELVVGVTPSSVGQRQYGAQFGPVIFYDGQGIMVSRRSGIRKIEELAGKTLCVLGGTEAEEVAGVALDRRGVKVLPSPFSEQGEMDAAVVGGRCAAETADVSRLAYSRNEFHAAKDDFVVLPTLLTIDPVAVAYRQADPGFGAVVDWTVNALIQAEASGITHANVAVRAAALDADPLEKRLLGMDFVAARALGLDPGWAVRAIAAVGNYGEIYDRALGPDSYLEIPRGLNALWTDGGLMRPAPVR